MRERTISCIPSWGVHPLRRAQEPAGAEPRDERALESEPHHPEHQPRVRDPGPGRPEHVHPAPGKAQPRRPGRLREDQEDQEQGKHTHGGQQHQQVPASAR